MATTEPLKDKGASMQTADANGHPLQADLRPALQPNWTSGRFVYGLAATWHVSALVALSPAWPQGWMASQRFAEGRLQSQAGWQQRVFQQGTSIGFGVGDVQTCEQGIGYMEHPAHS